MTSSTSYLKTLDNSLRILLQFDEAHREWGSRELSETIGLHRSVVYRILATLQHRGFVTPTERRGYFRLGTRLIQLGNIVLADIGLRDVARPIMVRLMEETSESVFLSVVDEDQALGIECIPNPQPIRLYFDIGHHSPLYAGASNKVLLAYLPPDKIACVIGKGLEALTPNTVTDPVRLNQDLAIIRQQGWAWSIGEMIPEVTGIAAPVRDSNHAIVASLGIAGHTSRFGEERMPLLIDQVQRAAADISVRLLTWRKN